MNGTDFGLLTGFFTSITYDPIILIMAAQIEKMNRKWVIFISVIISGLATGSQYYIHEIWEM